MFRDQLWPISQSMAQCQGNEPGSGEKQQIVKGIECYMEVFGFCLEVMRRHHRYEKSA